MGRKKPLKIFFGNDRLSNMDTVFYCDLDGYYKIDNGAFNNCKNLKTINISKDITEIETDSFDRVPLETIKVEEENEAYSSIDGVLFNKDGTELVKYPTNRKCEVYVVPKKVKKIRKLAFGWAEYLRKIILPDGLEEIQEMAFTECTKIHSIFIPKKVKKIEDSFIYFDNEADDNFETIYNESDVNIDESRYSGKAKIINIVGMINKKGEISEFKENLFVSESTTNIDRNDELASLYNYLSKAKSTKFKGIADLKDEEYYKQAAYNFFDDVELAHDVVAVYGTSHYNEVTDNDFGGGTEYYSHLAFTGAWDEWNDKDYINKIKNNGWHFATPYYNSDTNLFYELPEYDDWYNYSINGGLIILSDGVTAYHTDDCQEELIFKGRYIKNKIAYENLGTIDDHLFSLCGDFGKYDGILPEGAECCEKMNRVVFRKLEDLAKYVTFNIFNVQQ